VSKATLLAFGKYVPVNMKPVVRMCLASVVFHRRFLRQTLQSSHRLRGNSLFSDHALMEELGALVFCDRPTTTPASEMHATEMVASGIPPHVVMLTSFTGVQDAIAGMREDLTRHGESVGGAVEGTIRDLLDKNHIQADLNPTMIMSSVKSMFASAEDRMATLVSGIQDQLAASSAATPMPWPVDATAESNSDSIGFDAGTMEYTVPADYTLPPWKADRAWISWVAGASDGPPLMGVPPKKLPSPEVKAAWRKYRVFMEVCCAHVTEAGAWPSGQRGRLTHDQAATIYNDVLEVHVNIPGDKHERRHGELSWSTAARLQVELKGKRKRLAAEEEEAEEEAKRRRLHAAVDEDEDDEDED
jgi:hypothetical protein